MRALKVGTGGRTRAGTGLSALRILSPPRPHAGVREGIAVSRGSFKCGWSRPALRPLRLAALGTCAMDGVAPSDFRGDSLIHAERQIRSAKPQWAAKQPSLVQTVPRPILDCSEIMTDIRAMKDTLG